MDIWNVDNIIRKSHQFIQIDRTVRLWRMDSVNFKVIEQGSYLAILDNAAYTLINKKYSPAFQEIPEQVSLTSVEIYDFVRKNEIRDYVELKFTNAIYPETINAIDSSGSKAWGYNGHLFVSGEMKKNLEYLASGELEFHLGFSMFGG